MNLEKLNDILKSEPKYRRQQVKQAIFCDLIDDWQQATTLPLALREKLQDNCSFEIDSQIYHSADNKTSKALIVLHDSLEIEAVLMKHKDDRNTACVSTQVGCPLGCSFCATGQLGFTRNLTTYEIVEQVLLWNRYLVKQKSKNLITNVVFMGMGEPLLNYKNVIQAIAIMNDSEGLNIGARRISISTSGIVPQIKKLASEKLQINLAISLHAPNEKLRSELMPVNNQFSLQKVLQAVNFYINKTNRKVMFEYLMIDGVNDTADNAHELVSLLGKSLCVVNLIAYNPTNKYQPSNSRTIQIFKSILEKAGISVVQRYSFGQDIKAACGQLAGSNKLQS